MKDLNFRFSAEETNYLENLEIAGGESTNGIQTGCENYSYGCGGGNVLQFNCLNKVTGCSIEPLPGLFTIAGCAITPGAACNTPGAACDPSLNTITCG